MAEKQGNWFKKHKKLTIAGIIVILLILVGLTNSDSGTKVINDEGAQSGNSSSSQSENTSQKNSAGKLGNTIEIGGSQGIAVKLVSLIDPAQADNEFFTPDAGKRFVAIKLQINNKGQSKIDDNANNNTNVIGSDNQSYTTDYSTIKGCTNFTDGSYKLSSGSSATGCVVFQIPNSVKVKKIQFTPNSGFSGDTAEWEL